MCQKVKITYILNPKINIVLIIRPANYIWIQWASKNISGFDVFDHLQQGIRCRQDYHGTCDAVQTLKDCLLRKGSAPQEFLDALRRVKLNELADTLEHGR